MAWNDESPESEHIDGDLSSPCQVRVSILCCFKCCQNQD